MNIHVFIAITALLIVALVGLSVSPYPGIGYLACFVLGWIIGYLVKRFRG